jgi:hypothetical protein
VRLLVKGVSNNWDLDMAFETPNNCRRKTVAADTYKKQDGEDDYFPDMAIELNMAHVEGP